MYLNCCNERSAEKQRRLEQCLLELMQTEVYDNISVSALCEKAGISRKTFYRLFTCKIDVVYGLLDHTLMDYAGYVPDASVGPGEFHRFLAFFMEAWSNGHLNALLRRPSG